MRRLFFVLRCHGLDRILGVGDLVGQLLRFGFKRTEARPCRERIFRRRVSSLASGLGLGVRLGFRFLGARPVGDIPISSIQGREDA